MPRWLRYRQDTSSQPLTSSKESSAPPLQQQLVEHQQAAAATVQHHCGVRAIRRRAARAAAATVVLVVFAAAAFSSAFIGATFAGQPAAASPGGGGNVGNACTSALTQAQDRTRGGNTSMNRDTVSSSSSESSSEVSSNCSDSKVDRPVALTSGASDPVTHRSEGTVIVAQEAAEAVAAATDTVRLPPLHLLPSRALTSPPSTELFEVFPDCEPRASGWPGRPDFIVYCEDIQTGRYVSYWHEIPLNLTIDPRDNTSTMWVTIEIPKGTNAKIETQTQWPHTPMAQATVDGMAPPGVPRPLEKMRFYRAGPSLVNYGGVPQTWEASDQPDEVTGVPADNDPLDFIEIGGAPIPVGGVVRVRLLGALALLDQNETDWKIVVLNTRDPRVSEWHDVSDVPPDTRRQLYEFFRTYKVAEGKQANSFFVAADQEVISRPEDWDKVFAGRAVATAVVQAKHNDWRRLLGLNPGGGSRSGGSGCTTPRCVVLVMAAQQSGSVAVVGGEGDSVSGNAGDSVKKLIDGSNRSDVVPGSHSRNSTATSTAACRKRDGSCPAL